MDQLSSLGSFGVSFDIQHYEEASLEEEIRRGAAIVQTFFQGKFAEANEATRQFYGKTLYDTYLATVFLFIKTMFSFDPVHVTQCLESFKTSIAIALLIRKALAPGWIDWLQSKWNASTTIQCDADKITKLNPNLLGHSELVLAEAYFLRAAMMVATDDSGGWQLMIKEAFHLRQSFVFYSKEHAEVDKEYAAGVQLGLGFFSTLFSLLPPRLGKLFEIFGYYEPVDGTSLFMQAAKTRDTARSMFCEALVMLVDLSVRPMLEGNELFMQRLDNSVSQQVLASCLQKYPASVITKYFKARMAFLHRNISEAAEEHRRSMEVGVCWFPFRNITCWELIHCACARFEWNQAAKYAAILANESRWSKSFFTYAHGIFEWADVGALGSDIRALLLQVPEKAKRVAGQSIPHEKFAGRRVKELREDQLTVLKYELILLFDLFLFLDEKCLSLMKSEVDAFLQNSPTVADSVTAHLLLGLAYKTEHDLAKALTHFREAIHQKNSATSDWYAIPMVYCEAAQCSTNMKHAKKYYEKSFDYPENVLLRRLIMKRQAMCRYKLKLSK